MSEAIFLDASFWITARDKKDERFGLATEIFRGVLRKRSRLVTTLLVAAETHAYFARRPKLREFILDELEKSPGMRVEPVTESDQAGAIALLRKFDDKYFSLCDAVTFVVMERLEIRRALSFDHHFSQYGKFDVILDPKDI